MDPVMKGQACFYGVAIFLPHTPPSATCLECERTGAGLSTIRWLLWLLETPTKKEREKEANSPEAPRPVF